MSNTDVGANVVPGRSCAGCTMCCKLLTIEELKKPTNQWCNQCSIGIGCKIYDTKPNVCSDYYCEYLLNATIGEAWKPTRCRMVVTVETNKNRISILVDASRRDAWRREPYISDIKRMAEVATQNRMLVIVWQGLDAIAVLPDREINLGHLSDQVAITTAKPTSAGIKFDVVVLKRDDPRLASTASHSNVAPVSTSKKFE